MVVALFAGARASLADRRGRRNRLGGLRRREDNAERSLASAYVARGVFGDRLAAPGPDAEKLWHTRRFRGECAE